MIDRDLWASRFRQRLMDLDKTHADIARHFDVSREAVSQWAKGGLPRAGLWKEVADYLGCRKEWLFEGGDQMEADVMRIEDLNLLRKIKKLTIRQRSAVETQVDVLLGDEEEAAKPDAAHPRR